MSGVGKIFAVKVKFTLKYVEYTNKSVTEKIFYRMSYNRGYNYHGKRSS